MVEADSETKGRIDSDGLPWLNIEAKNLERHNEQMLSTLMNKEEHTFLEAWTAKDLVTENWDVVEQTVESYYLPRSSFAFLGEKLLSDWADIASDVVEIHNRVVGMQRIQASIILAGDSQIEDIRKRLMAWADRCVAQRLAKVAYKKGGALRHFHSVYYEMVSAIEKIAFREGTMNECFYSRFDAYFVWKIYDRTLRPLITCTFDREQLAPDFEVALEEPNVAEYIGEVVKLYQWQHANVLHETLALVAESLDEKQRAYSVDQIRDRLSRLVADIQEMRPFLRHNFSPDKVLLEVAPGVVLSFLWAVGRGMAVIPVAPTKEDLIEDLKANASPIVLNLWYDGQVTNHPMPWIDAEHVALSEPFALHANLVIVEALHAKLYSFYEKIDIDAILARFKSRAKDQPEAEEPTDEEFAAICQVIAEPIDQVEAGGGTASGVIRAVRVKRLLSILADKLGCEVRQGKGSEIVVFRQGGHHFRLGHHKQNSYVPTPVIKNILKHIGVSFEEWLGAMT